MQRRHLRSEEKCINPYTGRIINVDGPTYKKVVQQLATEGHTASKIKRLLKPAEQSGGGLFESLLDKAQSMGVDPTKGEISDLDEVKLVSQGAGFKKDPVIPDSKYHLLNSNRPPNPTEHSWYHYHAPFSQNFGDYVCVKRSTLRDVGTFLRDALTADVNGGNVK